MALPGLHTGNTYGRNADLVKDNGVEFAFGNGDEIRRCVKVCRAVQPLATIRQVFGALGLFAHMVLDASEFNGYRGKLLNVRYSDSSSHHFVAGHRFHDLA